MPEHKINRCLRRCFYIGIATARVDSTDDFFPFFFYSLYNFLPSRSRMTRQAQRMAQTDRQKNWDCAYNTYIYILFVYIYIYLIYIAARTVRRMTQATIVIAEEKRNFIG